MAGFTTVRDLGGTGVNISLRKAVNSGLMDGPAIYTAGRGISASGGHMDYTDGFRSEIFVLPPDPAMGIADGKDELIKAVRLQFKQGADVIKIAATGGDKTGSITPGKLADIIAVSGEPLQAITVMGKVKFAMKQGKIYKNN